MTPAGKERILAPTLSPATAYASRRVEGGTIARLAFIVSHPIQYYAPLHQRLATRPNVRIKVFFTWHGGETAHLDAGFGQSFAWDVRLTDGYDFEVVPNTSHRPGTSHFSGLRNPDLVRRVAAWKPDAVHITGYCWRSHLAAIRHFRRAGVRVLFRGDSHLLDGRGPWWRWQIKRCILRTIYSWPAAFLCVGQANKDYYRAFGVREARLWDCPHSVETARFAAPDAELEEKAAAWRTELGIAPSQEVLLYAAKFEDKKRPLPLMRAFLQTEFCDRSTGFSRNLPRTPAKAGTTSAPVLVMVGDGALGPQVRDLAAAHPRRFRVLPFQNQSRMPLVYRLGNLFVLPSAYGETWGLAINEALACGRPILVSDRVGCHADVVRPGVNGAVFAAEDWRDFQDKLAVLARTDWAARRAEIQRWAENWSIEKTEATLLRALDALDG